MGNLPCPHRHGRVSGHDGASGSGARPARRISIAEVEQNGWLIIFGKVYDVKDYMAKHPGGQDILLGVLGRDATVEFETMRHSQIALKQLEQLLLGSYDTATDSNQDTTQHEGLRKLGLTGGRDGSVAAESLWDVRCRGFLPAADPVKELPARWAKLAQLTDFIPSFGVQGRFRELAAVELEQTMPKTWEENRRAIENLSEGQLESLHSMLGYVCLAYLHSPPEIYEQDAEPVNIMSSCQPLDTLPPWLSRPWLCVSEKLERRPMLDYAGCVLNNWERIDPRRPLVPSNLRLLRRFTGLVDEEWFFKTHIVIEAEGSHVVSSLEAISSAVQNSDERILLEELRSLEQNLWRLSSVCLPIMFARSPRDHTLLCEPFLFFFRLRNYIKSLDVKMEKSSEGSDVEEFHLHGPSGAMSSILPAVDALLGICNTSVELREAVTTFEDYVPKAHRLFLERLRNAPQNVKSFIEEKKEHIDESTWFALAAAFNSCISRVLDFRWRHWSFVEQFIVRPSSSTVSASSVSVCPVAGRSSAAAAPPPVVGTGGTTFDYLQQHITDSQMARIPLGVTDTLLLKSPEVAKKLRPAVDVELEPLDGPSHGFWDPTGPNGFVSHRSACLAQWGNRFLKAPSPACRALVHLAGIIPNVCYTYPGLEHMEESSSYVHPFISKCESFREVLTGLQVDAMAVQDQEHAWLLLTFVCCAYRSAVSHVRHGTRHGTDARCSAEPRRASALRKLPPWLSALILHFEELLGREWHGSPEYSELVLNNWASSQESPHDFIISRETIHQVQPIARFIATPDEEWYRKLHLVLEAEGGRAISAAHKTIQPAIAMRDTGAVIAALTQLAQDVASLSNFQMQQFDQKDSRGEAVMMQRLRAFVAEDLSEEDYAVWVYAEGSSPLLPALHAILGLRKLDGIAGPLQEHWQMQGRRCMATKHRDFLDKLEMGVSVRAYCLCEWRKASVEGIAALEDAFNNCIEALLRYCSLRQRLVSRMFPDVSKIRLMNAEQEQVIRTGRLALLQMRRVADSHRMLLSRQH